MKAHANVVVVYRSPTKNSHWVSEALHIYIHKRYYYACNKLKKVFLLAQVKKKAYETTEEEE